MSTLSILILLSSWSCFDKLCLREILLTGTLRPNHCLPCHDISGVSFYFPVYLVLPGSSCVYWSSLQAYFKIRVGNIVKAPSGNSPNHERHSLCSHL